MMIYTDQQVINLTQGNSYTVHGELLYVNFSGHDGILRVGKDAGKSMKANMEIFSNFILTSMERKTSLSVDEFVEQWTVFLSRRVKTEG